MKISTATLLLLFIITNIYSQVSIKKQKDLGGNGFDNLIAIAATSDGGLILGGPSDSDSSGDKSQNAFRDNDFWVIKLDRQYNKQWDKTYGGQRIDNLISIIQTKDGGYLLGGSSNSMISGTKTDSSRGGQDYYLVKLDSAGNQLWDKTIGGNDWEFFMSMQQTSDGGFILGGFSSSGRSGEKTQGKVGEDDYWIVKLDSAHNIQWDQTIGGTAEDKLYTVRQTFDGGYILGGYSFSDSAKQKSQNNKGAYDYWIVKTDASGRIQWDRTIGSNSGDQFAALEQTSDSGYILLGTSDGNISGDKTENSKGSGDYWVVKINSKGKILWDKTIGGTDADLAGSIIQTADGGFLLSGNSLSNISADKTENSRGLQDFWTVKLNKKHIIEWDKTFGGNSGDYPNALLEQSKNNYVIGGTSWSGIFGDKTDSLKSPSFADFWLINFSYKKPRTFVAQSATSQMSIVTKDHFAYPNPAKNYINIQLQNPGTIQLIAIDGKKLFEQKASKTNFVINVSNMPRGIYFIKNITTGQTQKIILQ